MNEEPYVPVFQTNEVSFTIRLINKKYLLGGTNITTPITTSMNYLDRRSLFKTRQELFDENPSNETIIKMIETDKRTDYKRISDQLGITKDGAKYYIQKLRDCGLVHREGNSRTGYYEVFNEMDRPADFMRLDDETRQKVVKWCEKYFLPSETVFSGISSYGLKHILEQDTGIYLTNGQFKGAMLLAGYFPKAYDDLNWLFKISHKSAAVFMEKKA